LGAGVGSWFVREEKSFCFFLGVSFLWSLGKGMVAGEKEGANLLFLS